MGSCVPEPHLVQIYRWLAWTCDAIDFFSVSLSVTNLQAQFHKSAIDITTAITLTLLFRSVGAVSLVVQSSC
jgi:SHS family lactate transporter-like MFS transporter